MLRPTLTRPVDLVGARDLVDQALCEAARLLRTHARQQHGELVASQARDRRRVARDDVTDAAGDLTQQRIAHGVSERVVDRLEAVEIEAEDRRAFTVETAWGRARVPDHVQ